MWEKAEMSWWLPALSQRWQTLGSRAVGAAAKTSEVEGLLEVGGEGGEEGGGEAGDGLQGGWAAGQEVEGGQGGEAEGGGDQGQGRVLPRSGGQRYG